MATRINYEMSQEDFDKLLESMQPIPMIAIHTGNIGDMQVNAVHAAWKVLGEKMGFDYTTAQPSPRGGRFFSAEPIETVKAD